MHSSSHRDPSRFQVPPGQVRDGILLMLLGLVVATWLDPSGDRAPVTVGLAIAAWGLALVAQALWLRSRSRG